MDTQKPTPTTGEAHNSQPPQLVTPNTEQEPIVINKDAPGDLKIGDYVFASRWSDCDPGDPWHVGHVSEIGPNYVVCGDVSIRHWRKAMKITAEQGARICAEFPALEKICPSDYLVIARVFGENL